jgi:hypothetical protein
MKTLPALLSLALGFSLATSVATAAPKPASVPAAKPAAQPAAEDKLDEKNLVGILIPRNNGGFTNLKIDGGKFTMTFFDANKKAIAPDVTHATVKYRKGKSNHRHLLVAVGGKSLQAPTPVDRPYIVNGMHVVLFDDNEDTAAEAYTVNFKQPTAEDGAAVPVDEMTPEQLAKIKK